MKNVWKTILAGTAISSVLFMAVNVEAAYTVQKGDTLTKIAKAHNTTTQQLKLLNKLTSDQIYINQKLVVAATDNAVTNTSKVEEKKGEVKQPITYTVVSGDNLTKIAEKYNTTVDLLKQWNKLSSDALFVGQKLTLGQVSKALTTELTHKDATTITQTSREKTIETVEKNEVVVNNNDTIDEKIAKQLAGEEEITDEISSEAAIRYAQALQNAQQLIGIPYKYGGNTIEGFDCSGFVTYLYNTVGIELTRKSSLMFFEQDTTKVKEPVPGDLVFFKNTFIPDISHMGIYIGNNEFIHASSTGIAIGNVTTKYWSERLVAYKRLNSVK